MITFDVFKEHLKKHTQNQEVAMKIAVKNH